MLKILSTHIPLFNNPFLPSLSLFLLNLIPYSYLNLTLNLSPTKSALQTLISCFFNPVFPHYLSFFLIYLLFPAWHYIAEYLIHSLLSITQLFDVPIVYCTCSAKPRSESTFQSGFYAITSIEYS